METINQNLFWMQPKNIVEDKGPPSPTMVLLLSLFGYPGVGHFMCGGKKSGTLVALVFTGLTLGLVVELMNLLGPLLKLLTEGVPMEVAPDWTRISFWIASTTVVWLGSGLHSYFLAKKLN